MISDILFDAEDKIADYLREFPEIYAPTKAEIEALLHQMRCIRQRLDTPPAGGAA